MPLNASLEVVVDVQRFVNIELLSQGLYYVTLRLEGPSGDRAVPFELACSRLPGRDDYVFAPQAEILRSKTIRGRAFNVQFVEQCETVKELYKFALTADAEQLIGSTTKRDVCLVAELFHLSKEKLLKTVIFQYVSGSAPAVPYPDSVQKLLRKATFTNERTLDLKYSGISSKVDMRRNEETLSTGEVRRIERSEQPVDAGTFERLTVKRVPIITPLTPHIEYLPIVFDGCYFCKLDVMLSTSLTGVSFLPDKTSSLSSSQSPLGNSYLAGRAGSTPPSETDAGADGAEATGNGASNVAGNSASNGAGNSGGNGKATHAEPFSTTVTTNDVTVSITTPPIRQLPPPSDVGSPVLPEAPQTLTPPEQTLASETANSSFPEKKKPKKKDRKATERARSNMEMYRALLTYLTYAIYRLESWGQISLKNPGTTEECQLLLDTLLACKTEYTNDSFDSSDVTVALPVSSKYLNVFQTMDRLEDCGREYLLQEFFSNVDDRQARSRQRAACAVTTYALTRAQTPLKCALFDTELLLLPSASPTPDPRTPRTPRSVTSDTQHPCAIDAGCIQLLQNLSNLLKSMWDLSFPVQDHVLKAVDEARSQEAFFSALRRLAIKNLEVYDSASAEASAVSEAPLSPRVLSSPRIDKTQAPEHSFFDYEKRTHIRIRELRPEIDVSSSVIANIRKQRALQHALPSSGQDLIIFVHGWKGSCADLCLFKNYLAVYLPPDKEYYCVKNMADMPNAPIKDLGEVVAKEVRDFIQMRDLQIDKLSFVGHSMGCVVIRAALMSKHLDPYLDKLHTFISFAGPHLGIAKQESAKVGCVIGFLSSARWMSNIRDLSLETLFMHSLSSADRTHLFRHVLMFGSESDQFVGPGSALAVQPPSKGAVRKGKMGKGAVVDDMARNLSAASVCCETYRRFVVSFAPHGRRELTSWYDRVIGRSIHICFLVDVTFLNLVALLFKDYFL